MDKSVDPICKHSDRGFILWLPGPDLLAPAL
jgi:hypothetical protein